MAQPNTQTAEYWNKEFQVTQDDLDYVFSVLLETETPLSIDEIALIAVRYRLSHPQESVSAQPDVAKSSYDPTQVYKVGDKFLFPEFGNKPGEVIDIRPGDNPDYGDYSVLEVKFAGSRIAEFASGLTVSLTPQPEEESQEAPEDREPMSAEEIFIEWGGGVAQTFEESLHNQPDLVRLAGRWFPKSLLANVNSGHLNLAEAILDMNGGGPMTTRDIMEQVGMMRGINDRLAEFSLNYGLQEDERFDEVGPSGQVLWFLHGIEPEGVLHLPVRLEYAPISSDAGMLSEELREIEMQIGDEHTELLSGRILQTQSANVTLIYPHLRSGTLPLSPALRSLFPTAYQSPRIHFTLVDDETGEETSAWVVRPGGYVYGVGGFFERHEIPIGGYLTIERTELPGRVLVKAPVRKPRKEWVRVAHMEKHHLRFEIEQRAIAAGYDDLMIMVIEDQEAVDELASRLLQRKVPLEETMAEILRDLAAGSPQGNVHAKTLYSAVNIVRRCPPGPIFARLMALPEFEHVAGPYWRLRLGEGGA